MKVRCFAIIATLALALPVLGQPTAFTYQGRLKNGAASAAGLHDFRFRLWDAASGGTQLGTTLCVDNILVTEGLFTSTIDFGQQYASPSQRFLEIEVRADSGLNCSNIGGFVLLAPRQLLTAAPLASHARSAFSLAAADGSPADAVIVDNSGNVGIGTAAPAVPLQIARDIDPVMVIQDTGPASTQAGYLGFWNSTSVETGWMGFGTPGSPHLSVFNGRFGGHIALLPGSGGNVGVGTGAPAAKLDVRGNIKLGSTGQYSALGGQEDLRLIRGDIDGNGTIVRGTGFTVNRSQEGVYDVTFVPVFSGIPTVMAVAEIGTGQPRWATSAQFFLSASTARIIMHTGGGFTDSDWSLCVIGPR
jgi:hypothetical protein